MTPLNPDANHLDILTQHLLHLRRGEPVLKPVYDHRDGDVRRAALRAPGDATWSSRGCSASTPRRCAAAHDVRVFLAPPEELRRAWKVKRDCTRRGYTTDQVLCGARPAQRDAEQLHPAPAAAHADIVVGFRPHPGGDPAHLDAEVVLRDSLPHPDLAPLSTASTTGRRSNSASASGCCGSPGTSTRRTRRDRGGGLGADELRQPPARPAARASSRSARTCCARTRSRSCSC